MEKHEKKTFKTPPNSTVSCSPAFLIPSVKFLDEQQDNCVIAFPTIGKGTTEVKPQLNDEHNIVVSFEIDKPEEIVLELPDEFKNKFKSKNEKIVEWGKKLCGRKRRLEQIVEIVEKLKEDSFDVKEEKGMIYCYYEFEKEVENEFSPPKKTIKKSFKFSKN